MNIFDIPELVLTEEERMNICEMFMFEDYDSLITDKIGSETCQIDFNGLIFMNPRNNKYIQSLAQKFFTSECQPTMKLGAAVNKGTAIRVHTDDYTNNFGRGDDHLAGELEGTGAGAAPLENLPLFNRRTVVCFPITPKENYSRLYYPDTDESRGWSDHAYCFDTFQPHGVEYSERYRLNLQFGFSHCFKDFHELYTSGKLIRT